MKKPLAEIVSTLLGCEFLFENFTRQELERLQSIVREEHQDYRLIRRIWAVQSRQSYIVTTEATDTKVAGLYEIPYNIVDDVPKK